MTELEQLFNLLDSMDQDYSIPRNVRRRVENVKKILSDESVPNDLRKANALEILDDLANNPNVPMHARSLIWNAMGLIEAFA
jgi:Uncharacterized protein conserved in archaea